MPQKLEQETGLVIENVHDKGYRLASSLSLLNQQTIAQQFKQWPIHIIDSVNSTNSYVLELFKQHQPCPIAVTAEQQTQGRGRRGKQWLSLFGQNIYYSVMIQIKQGLHQLEGLSLTIALAVLQTLKHYGIKNAGLKWPNDILIDGKKVSGILLELHGNPADICQVVIGIGLNVNMQQVTQDFSMPWTSMYQETGRLFDRNQLIIDLSQSLNDYLTIHQTQGFSHLKEQWEAHNVWQNKIVNLLQGNQQISGKMLGIDNTGALKLEIQGDIQYFNAGEVSLRLAPSTDQS